MGREEKQKRKSMESQDSVTLLLTATKEGGFEKFARLCSITSLARSLALKLTSSQRRLQCSSLMCAVIEQT